MLNISFDVLHLLHDNSFVLHLKVCNMILLFFFQTYWREFADFGLTKGVQYRTSTFLFLAKKGLI